jgi:hypothetical protein
MTDRPPPTDAERVAAAQAVASAVAYLRTVTADKARARTTHPTRTHAVVSPETLAALYDRAGLRNPRGTVVPLRAAAATIRPETKRGPPTP